MPNLPLIQRSIHSSCPVLAYTMYVITTMQYTQEVAEIKHNKLFLIRWGYAAEANGKSLSTFILFALFQSPILTAGNRGFATTSADHARDPVTDSLTRGTILHEIRASRVACPARSQVRWINLKTRDRTLCSKLAILPPQVQGGNWGPGPHQRPSFTLSDRGGHGGGSIAKEDIHIFQSNATGFGVQEIN